MRNTDPCPITYAEVEDMQTEIDRLRYEVERWKHVAENKWGIDDLQKYQAEIDRLRAALLEYGGHQHSCRRNMYPLLEPQICDCGWAEFFIKYTKKEGE